jgi:general secretion pathway protein C
MRDHPRKRWLLSLAAILGTLGAGSIFVAEGLSKLLTNPSTILSDAALADRNTSPVRTAMARQLAERVLARNIFDSTTGPLSWDGTTPPPPLTKPQAPIGNGEPPPRCGGGLRLVASIVNAAHPERSFAAVRREDKTHLLALGGQLDDLTLFALRPTRAYLHAKAGSLCFLPVFLSANERPTLETKAPAPRVAHEEKPKPKSKQPLFSKEELERGVTPVGRGGYAVARELLLRALKDPGSAGAGAQFRAVERDGATGMEVRSVRNGSPLKAMGIQNGDVVRSLNGADLTTPVGLLTALRTVRESDTVTLTLVRDNVTQSIQYLLD